MLVLITPIVHENGFRGLIVGVIVLAVGFYIATDLAPLITSAAANVNFDMGGAAAISSICDGANPLTWVITRLGQLGDGIGLVIPLSLLLPCCLEPYAHPQGGQGAARRAGVMHQPLCSRRI